MGRSATFDILLLPITVALSEIGVRFHVPRHRGRKWTSPFEREKKISKGTPFMQYKTPQEYTEFYYKMTSGHPVKRTVLKTFDIKGKKKIGPFSGFSCKTVMKI